VTLSVTTGAQRNQIVRHVPTQLAPMLHVMNLQVLCGTAVLTPPTVSFQHLLSDQVVFFGVQFESWLFLTQAHRIHWILEIY
jgi:hypothetical protein